MRPAVGYYCPRHLRRVIRYVHRVHLTLALDFGSPVPYRPLLGYCVFFAKFLPNELAVTIPQRHRSSAERNSGVELHLSDGIDYRAGYD